MVRAGSDDTPSSFYPILYYYVYFYLKRSMVEYWGALSTINIYSVELG